MKRLLILGILLIVSSAHSQRTDNLDVFEMLLKAKYEYIAEGIGDEEFNKLDSVYVRDMPYPNVGYWNMLRGRHFIYLHPYALRNKLALEYTLLHELGHMHGILDHDMDPDSMMFKFHQPPENEAQWLEMKRAYYNRLRLIRKEKIATVE